MKKVGDQDHRVVSFVHKTTHESYSPDGLRDQISNGIVKRDWSDLVSGTWAFTIFQAAAAVTGVGLFVTSLDFAYNAIKASTLLADAFAAGKAAMGVHRCAGFCRFDRHSCASDRSKRGRGNKAMRTLS